MLPAPVVKTKAEVAREKWVYYQLAVWRGGIAFQAEKFIRLAEGRLDQKDIRDMVLNRLWLERHFGKLGYSQLKDLHEKHKNT